MPNITIVIGNGEITYTENLQSGTELPVIAEYEDGRVTEVKKGLYYYAQGKNYYQDSNMNNLLVNRQVPGHDATYYYLGLTIGQPKKGAIQYFFTQGKEGVYSFNVESVGKKIYIEPGIYTNQGILSSAGNWSLSVSNNETQNLALSLKPSDILTKSKGTGMLSVNIPFKIYGSSAKAQEIGSLEIWVEFNYRPTGGND